MYTSHSCNNIIWNKFISAAGENFEWFWCTNPLENVFRAAQNPQKIACGAEKKSCPFLETRSLRTFDRRKLGGDVLRTTNRSVSALNKGFCFNKKWILSSFNWKPLTNMTFYMWTFSFSCFFYSSLQLTEYNFGLQTPIKLNFLWSKGTLWICSL